MFPKKICEFCYKALKVAYTIQKISQSSDRALKKFTDNRSDVLKTEENDTIKQEIEESGTIVVTTNYEENKDITELLANTDAVFQLRKEIRELNKLPVSKQFDEADNNGSVLDDTTSEISEDLEFIAEYHKGQEDGSVISLQTSLESESSGKKRKRRDGCESGELSTDPAYSVKSDLSQISGSSYKCSLCEDVFYSLDYYVKHRRMKHQVKKFRCPVCQSSFKSSRKYAKHKKVCVRLPKRFSSPAQIFACDICSEKFRCKKRLESHHIKYHTIEQYSCKFCLDRKYSTKARLEIHISKRHVLLYKCEICSRKFSSLNKCKRHEKISHVKQQKYICSYCRKREFKDFEKFRDHQERCKYR